MGILQSFMDWATPRSNRRRRGSRGRAYTGADGSRFGQINEEITPDDVGQALMDAEAGNLGPMQELLIKLPANDPHIKSELGKLTWSISNYPLRVSVAKSKTPEAIAAKEMIEDVFAHPRFKSRKAIRQMAATHYRGVSVFDPAFEVEPGPEGDERVYMHGMDLISPTRYRMEVNTSSEDAGKLRIWNGAGEDNHPQGRLVEDYPEGFVMAMDDGEHGEGWYDVAGVGRTILYWYCVKHFNAKWWSQLNETYGEPLRVGYYEEWSGDDERRDMKDFLKGLSRSAWAMFQADQEIEFIQAEVAGQVQTYDDLIALADQQISKALVGQIGTSGRDKNGSYGEATVLNSIRYEIAQSVSGLIEENIFPLIHYLCRVNIDTEFRHTDVPRVYVVVPNPGEKKQKVEVFKGAMEMGISIPEQFARDELGIPAPSEDEDALEPADLMRGADGSLNESDEDPDEEDGEEDDGDSDEDSGAEEPETEEDEGGDE